jgi:N-acetylmuramoyl-L-alanine amidase
LLDKQESVVVLPADRLSLTRISSPLRGEDVGGGEVGEDNLIQRDEGMNIKKKIRLAVSLTIIFIPFFCFALNIREEIKERKIPTYLIENNSYISLKSLLKILGAENSWGRVEDRVFIKHQDMEIKFKVNSTQVFIDKKVEYLGVPVKEVEGEILIPVDDFSNILSGVSVATGVAQGQSSPKKEEKIIVKDKNKSFIILIDPGHGGSDNGATGYYGLKEKDVNLDIAKRMKEYLTKELKGNTGVKIYMTREEDVNVSLPERVQMAKDINADVFFSIHTNSSLTRRPDADGFETYYSGIKEDLVFLPSSPPGEVLDEEVKGDTSLSRILEDLNTTSAVDESRILADFVQERLAERLLTPDRGTKRRGFYVLRYTPMPAILTEIGFLCNPNVELNLRDAEVRQAIAESLAKGLLDYLKFRDVI